MSNCHHQPFQPVSSHSTCVFVLFWVVRSAPGRRVAAQRLQLESFTDEGLVTTFWGSAKLAPLAGASLPAWWLDAVEAESERRLAFLGPVELSTLLYAYGQLGCGPTRPGWLRQYFKAAAAGLDVWGPQPLSNLLYSCARLQLRPPEGFLALYWEASRSQLGVYLPQVRCWPLGCGCRQQSGSNMMI